jgi:GNAT superfamily N-acetyltransferase
MGRHDIISIRRATAEDTEGVARLSDALGYPVDLPVMGRRLRAIAQSDADLLVVAVTAQEEVAGWLQAHASHIVESGFRVEITGLIVSPSARRRGAGRALVAEAESWARGLEAEALVVRSNLQRHESHPFYAALKFEPTKTQQVYRKLLRLPSSPGSASPPPA